MPAFTPTATGIRLYLRVTPNAGRDGFDGVETRDNGEAVLRVRVAAVPDRGKANVAAIALVARALGCARSSITLVSGETSRFKTLLVTGDPAKLASGMGIIESSGA